MRLGSRVVSLEDWLTLGLVAAIALPGVLAGSVIVVSFIFTPEAIAQNDHLVWLGLAPDPCVGCGLCGMSRAFSAFSHGAISRAIAYHRGVVVAWPLAAILTPAAAFGVVRTLRTPPRFLPSRLRGVQ